MEITPDTPARTGSAIRVQGSPTTRLQSVDLLRGVVLVLMAIDHVRVYSGIPAGGPSPGIFFTRWVTHFCAPSFVFLAGVSAFLYGHKQAAGGNPAGKGMLARYLVTRGFLLVLLELTVIRFFWMFNFDYANFTLAGVIWMLGWCMIILAAFIRLRPAVVGITGLAVIFLQQLFHYVPLILPGGWRKPFGWFWEFFYPSGLDSLPGISILYVLLPWAGVMMAGYGFGQLLIREPAVSTHDPAVPTRDAAVPTRDPVASPRDPAALKKICLRIGLGAIALFLTGGILFILFGPPYKGPLPFLFRLLAQQKYPPSQLFLLMTLGPLIALAPAAERSRGRIAAFFRVFGRVPLFYYLLHILLIHATALLVNILREGVTHQQWYTTAPFTEIPEEHRWGLALLYLVFVLDVAVLYFACRWYGKYKFGHPEKRMLKYL